MSDEKRSENIPLPEALRQRHRKFQEDASTTDIVPRHTGPGGCGKLLTDCRCESNVLRKSP